MSFVGRLKAWDEDDSDIFLKRPELGLDSYVLRKAPT